MQCEFCVNVKAEGREVIAENDAAWAFLTYTPIVPGHTLVCPKRCVGTFEELTQDELEALFELRRRISDSMRLVLKAEGFNYAWNEGSTAGQSVSHLHLHIVPRKEGDTGVYEYEPRQFLYRPGTRNQSPIEELGEISQLLKSAIS